MWKVNLFLGFFPDFGSSASGARVSSMMLCNSLAFGSRCHLRVRDSRNNQSLLPIERFAAVDFLPH